MALLISSLVRMKAMQAQRGPGFSDMPRHVPPPPGVLSLACHMVSGWCREKSSGDSSFILTAWAGGGRRVSPTAPSPCPAESLGGLVVGFGFSAAAVAPIDASGAGGCHTGYRCSCREAGATRLRVSGHLDGCITQTPLGCTQGCLAACLCLYEAPESGPRDGRDTVRNKDRTASL